MEISMLLPLFITFIILFIIYKAIRGIFSGGGKISGQGGMVCPSCGTRGEPRRITKGSTGIELLLWICFIVPGLIYSIWRLTTRYDACPECGQPGMIGINTPIGQRLLNQ